MDATMPKPTATAPSDDDAPFEPPPEAFLHRDLSWLGFAGRVLELVEDARLPLLERVKFAGIMGMLHDEFYMKRVSGLRQKIRKGDLKPGFDGVAPDELLRRGRLEIARQVQVLSRTMNEEIRPALRREGLALLDHAELDAGEVAAVRARFRDSVLPILTPLAVDTEHPFPFISGLGINLAVRLPDKKGRRRFVRVKVPDNRSRWVEVDGRGWVPLEQVIAANLDLLFDQSAPPPERVHFFRVTRGASGESAQLALDDRPDEPGSIIKMVRDELKARRFAGAVRMQVDPSMPEDLANWLAAQLEVDPLDSERAPHNLLGIQDLLSLRAPARPDLRYPAHHPATHPRLAGLPLDEAAAIFERIAEGDILLHHPYDSFDTSVLRFLESAAADPAVLALKLTIYRTSTDSPIIHALAEAARNGKQVAVLVEITARFDEAPNIEWGRYLEGEGVHVAYGVEKLKTHVKAALVVREEGGRLVRYAHVGTGNYHAGTARLYEDVGLLTRHPEICADVAAVFNELTGAWPTERFERLLVAPRFMRARFLELIRREIAHAQAGRPSGIEAKMNQLQDKEMITELYRASRAGVPIHLHVRGLCCLRPGLPGLSETITLQAVTGRFLEHSRVYRFENGGDPEHFIGSADWMGRNLNKRMETITPILDDRVKEQLDAILEVHRRDNFSAWDGQPDGTYIRRRPAEGEPPRGVQDVLIAQRAAAAPDPD